MLTDEQKKKRCAGIGASDTPIIMGYSNYKTPYQLYLEKTGVIESEEEETEQQYWGNALESLIIQRFSQENDAKITFPETVYHPIHSFIFANLDGWIPKENAVVEAKNVNSFKRKEWDMALTDGIPMVYLIQIAKQCLITNATKGYCAVLIGGCEYKQFIYERDKTLEDIILKADLEFWRCIQERIEPDPANSSDCRLKYKTPHPDKIAESTYKTANALTELQAVKEQIKKNEAYEDHLKMTLMAHMGSAEYLMGQNEEILATWKATKKGTRVFNIK